MPFDTLSDFITENCGVLIECESGHFATLTAQSLQAICIERGWGDQITVIVPHLKCKRCGARAKEVWPQRATGLGR